MTGLHAARHAEQPRSSLLISPVAFIFLYVPHPPGLGSLALARALL